MAEMTHSEIRTVRSSIPSASCIRFFLAGCVAAALPLIAAPASAQVTLPAITPSANSYIWAQNPATPYGGGSTLLIKYVSTGSVNDREIYLRFAVPAEPVITSAFVKMYGGYPTSGDSAAIVMYPVTYQDTGNNGGWDSWTDSGLTWNNAPVPSGVSTIASTTVTNTQQYWSWNVTSYITSNLLAGGDFDMVLEATSNVASTGIATFSSDHATGNYPELVITVPAPSAPTNLNVTDDATNPETSLDITWVSGATPGATYTLFRSQTQGFTPGTGNQVAAGIHNTNYTDTSRTPGTRYYYQVEAVSDGGTSAPSNEGHATTATSLQPGVAILMEPSDYTNSNTYFNPSHVSGSCPANSTNTPIMNAVCDLQQDLLNVFGTSSQVYTTETTALQSVPLIVITHVGGSLTGYIDNSLSGQTESHELSLLQGAVVSTSPQRTVLQGADTRGAIYAIYEFSDSFLGVPPLYRWTGWTAPTSKLTEVQIAPNYLKTFASPAVKYRGLFPNDTDLLKPWMAASTANYNAFFETMLRLKYNLLDVASISDVPSSGSTAVPDTGLLWAQTCAERGLIVTFTHTAPFGAKFGDWQNFWNWSSGGNNRSIGSQPPAYTDTTNMQAFWQYYLNLPARYGITEVLETLAFRGDGDEPWWEYVRNDPNPGSYSTFEADQIASELNTQLSMLIKTSGQSNPLARTIFYDEGQTFMIDRETAGYAFAVPDASNDSNLIWSFANTQRDHFPAADAQGYSSSSIFPHYSNQLIGNYENFEYTSSGSHLVSNEGPAKMEANHIYLMAKPPAGKYALTMLNSGNFREFTLEVAAAANLLWNGTGTGGYTTTSFLPTFAGRYFVQGVDSGAAINGATNPCTGTICSNIANVYTSYYGSYSGAAYSGDQWQQKTDDFNSGAYNPTSNPFPNQYIFQDLRYYQAAMRLMKDMEAHCYSNTTKCGAVTGVPQSPYTFDGTNPFVDPTGDTDEYEITQGGQANGGSYGDAVGITNFINATGTAQTNFSATLSNCNTEKALIASTATAFFEDSLCSHAEMMQYLNGFAQNIAYANQHVGDANYTTLNGYLVSAQTALNNFIAAMQKRQAGTVFPLWYASPVTAVAVSGSGSSWTATVTGTNQVKVGDIVVLTGLQSTAAAYLQGIKMTVATASSSSYTATFTGSTGSALSTTSVTALTNETTNDFSIGYLQENLTVLLGMYPAP